MGKVICRLGLIAGALAAASLPAKAQDPAPQRPVVVPQRPFTTTLSNTAPLVFGMDVRATEQALGTPLTYVEGKPGNEMFMVIRRINGEGFLFRNDPLYLQFRKGHLTGWKGDWSRPWLWW